MRRIVEDLSVEELTGREALVEGLRLLNLAGGTTNLEPAALAAITAQVHDLTRALKAGPSLPAQPSASTGRVVRAGFLQPRDCAVAGQLVHLNQLNPGLLDLHVHFGHEQLGPAGVLEAVTDGDPTGLTAEATVVVNGLHEGPTDSIHGGIISFLMDCLLGVLVQATGIPSVTGSLELRYLQRTPLDRPVTLRARIARHEGRKLFVEGWIIHEDQITVRADGIFIAVAERRPAKPNVAEEES